MRFVNVMGIALSLALLSSSFPVNVCAQEIVSEEYVAADESIFDFENADSETASEADTEYVQVDHLSSGDNSGKCGDSVLWQFDNGTLTLSGSGSMYDYTSDNPSPWDNVAIKRVEVGEGITRIGNYAFYSQYDPDPESPYFYEKSSRITEVVLPQSLESIGEYAFYGNCLLANIDLPSGVKEIGQYAFYYCVDLRSIEIPAGVERIEYGCFFYCRRLAEVKLPFGIKHIMNGAFNYCGLESIVIPNSVYTIRDFAFANCDKLISVSIPRSMDFIDAGVFSSCTALTDVYYGGSKKEWERLEIRTYNEPLLSATIHYGAEDAPIEQGDEIVIDEGGKYEVLDSDVPSDGNIPEGVWIAGVKDLSFTGTLLNQDFRVYDGTTMLVQNTDYTVSYKNTKAVYEIKDKDNLTESDKKKAPQVTIKMKGNYTGSQTLYFSILPLPTVEPSETSLPKVSMSKVKAAKITNLPFKGDSYTASDLSSLIRLQSGSALTEGTDYRILSVANGENVGTATVMLQGLEASESSTGSSFTGQKAISFKIVPKSISDSSIKVNDGSEISTPFTKGGACPSIVLHDGDTKLKEGKDYTVKYSVNAKLASSKDAKAPTVTIFGKGNYTGKLPIKYSITKRAFGSGITVLASDRTESAKAGQYMTKVQVIDVNGKVLKPGTDYEKSIGYFYDASGAKEVSKTDNPPAGTVIYAAVTGKGSYSNQTIYAPYTILARNGDISKAKFKVKNQTYTGEQVLITDQNQFDMAVIGSDTLLLNGENGFEVIPGTYQNNVKKGTAKVTLHGTGKYGGYKTVTFKIGARSLKDAWIGTTKYYQTNDEIIQLLKQYCVRNITDVSQNVEGFVDDYFSYQIVKSSILPNGTYAFCAEVSVYRTYHADVLVMPDGTIYNYEEHPEAFEQYKDFFPSSITDLYGDFWVNARKDPTYLSGGYGSNSEDDEKTALMSRWCGTYRLDDVNTIEILSVSDNGTISFRFTVTAADGSAITNNCTGTFTDDTWTAFSMPYQSGANEIFRLEDTGIRVSLDIDMRGANDGLYVRD